MEEGPFLSLSALKSQIHYSTYLENMKKEKKKWMQLEAHYSSICRYFCSNTMGHYSTWKWNFIAKILFPPPGSVRAICWYAPLFLEDGDIWRRRAPASSRQTLRIWSPRSPPHSWNGTFLNLPFLWEEDAFLLLLPSTGPRTVFDMIPISNLVKRDEVERLLPEEEEGEGKT